MAAIIGVSQEERANIFLWFMRLKAKYGFQEVTILQALMLLDRFLVLNVGSVEAAVLPLIGMVCL